MRPCWKRSALRTKNKGQPVLLSKNLIVTATFFENEVLKDSLLCFQSSKDRMMTGLYLVFRFLLEQTELQVAPGKNGPVT